MILHASPPAQLITRLRDYAGDVRLGWEARRVVPRPLAADAEGIRQLRGLRTVREAAAFAARVDARASRVAAVLRVFGPRGGAAWSTRLAPAAGTSGLLHALAEGPVLLAMPLHEASLGALGTLLARHEGPVRIQRTALTQLLLEAAVSAEGPRAELLTDRELLQRSHATPAVGTPHALWVTFPDHHTAGREGCQLAQLCGQPHHFTLLEYLLCARAGAALWSIRHEGGTAELQAVGTTAGHAGDAGLGTSLPGFYDGLAGALSSVVAGDPEGLLCWSRLERNAAGSLARRDLARVSTLREIVRGCDAYTGARCDGPVPALDELSAQLRAGRAATTPSR